MRLKFPAVLTVVVLFGIAGPVPAELTIDQLVEQARLSEGKVAVRDMPRWTGAKKVLVRDIGVDTSMLDVIGSGIQIVTVTSISEALEHAAGADAVIGYCDAELIDAATNLIWVQIFSAGAERCVVVDSIANGSVVMTNMQKMSSPVIAEHAIAMMLSLTRNLPQFVNAMHAETWGRRGETTTGMAPIAGQKLLVAGLGGIGMEVARLGDALGMSVSGTRNSSRDAPDYVDYVGLSHELHDLAATADVVVNALPLTNSTKGLFDAEFFAAVKPGAIFVNVGRGQTVVTDDLVAALESGQVSGAGLDVSDPEPLPAGNPLWQRDDVIITPHVAGYGGELERHKLLLLENLKRYVAGDPLLNVVDPQKGY